jgi:hypothetical protein
MRCPFSCSRVARQGHESLIRIRLPGTHGGPCAGSDTTVTGEPASPSSPSRTIAARVLPASTLHARWPSRSCRSAASSCSSIGVTAVARVHPSSSGVMGSRRTSTTSRPDDRIRSSRLPSAAWSCTGPYSTISAGSTLTIRPRPGTRTRTGPSRSGDQQGGSRSFHHQRAQPTPLTMSSRIRAGPSRRARAGMRLDHGGGAPGRPHLLRVISSGGGRP